MADKVVEAVSIELTPPMVIVPPFAADIPCANKFGLLIVRLLKVVVMLFVKMLQNILKWANYSEKKIEKNT